MKNTNEKIKYFIYARKSSESEDRQMNSVEDQIEILTKIAKKENLHIVDVFSESASAKKTGRKVFTEMMERIHKGDANGILVWKLNRLSRNSLEGGMISHALETEILQEIKTSGKTYYPTDNVLMMAVELGMSTQYSRDLSKDTKRGLLKKAERGWAPYLAPLGYVKHPDMIKGSKEIINDEERFYLIRKLWDMVLSGNYNPTQAINILNNKYGLRNKKGKKIASNSAYQILRNTFYYGEFEYPRNSGNWYKGKHEAMITKKEFNKVQTMISNHSKTNNDTELKDLFPYKSNLKCGSCGQSINAERKKRITCDCKHRFSALKTETCSKCNLHLSKMKNPKIENRVYYSCKNKYCDEKTTEVSVIENNVIDMLNQLSEFPKELMDLTMSTLKRLESKEKRNLENNSTILKRKLREKERKLDNLIEIRLSGEIDSETFKKAQYNYKEEIIELKHSLQNNNTNETVEKMRYYVDFSEFASSQFKKADDIKKKEIFSAISSNQSLIGGKVLLPKDSIFYLLLELSNGYMSHKSTLRTNKIPYLTTKKAPFQVLDSQMLHR